MVSGRHSVVTWHGEPGQLIDMQLHDTLLYLALKLSILGHSDRVKFAYSTVILTVKRLILILFITNLLSEFETSNSFDLRFRLSSVLQV